MCVFVYKSRRGQCMTLDTGSLLIFILLFIRAHLHSTRVAYHSPRFFVTKDVIMTSLVDQLLEAFDVVGPRPICQCSYYSSNCSWEL